MSQKNVRENTEELQEIISQFDRDDLSVEDALELFEKGSELSKTIEKQLAELKTKISVLQKKFDTESE